MAATSLSSSSSSSDQYRDWSNGLSTDLVGDIISHFTSSGDRVRFAAVSKPWRQSAAMISHKGRPSHPPWLMILGLSEAYSFSERKPYQIEHLSSQRCIGSDIGWVVVADDLSDGNLQLINLNAVTGSTTTRLPLITTLGGIQPVFNKRGSLTGYELRTQTAVRRPEFKRLEDIYAFYNKAVFFPSAFLVFLIYNDRFRIAFASVGADDNGDDNGS